MKTEEIRKQYVAQGGNPHNTTEYIQYLESQNKELIEGWKYCPICGCVLEHIVFTDINTKLICVNKLCETNKK